jgi:RecA/RadA recombinase
MVKNKKSSSNKVETETTSLSGLQHSFEDFLISTNKNLMITDENKLTIPTGIDILDAIMGGGISMKFSMIAGPPGGGKSTLVAKIIAAGQKKWPGKFISMYLDSEESMTVDRLYNLGVGSPRVNPINEVTVEKVFKFAETLCTFKEKNKECIEVPSVIIWDSIANTHTESMLESDERTNTMAAQRAAALAYYLPKIIPRLSKYNISLIGINQIRDEIIMDKYNQVPKAMNFMKSGVVPGGKSLIHNSLQALELYPVGGKDEIEKTLGFKGIKVRINAVRNKIFSPNIPVELVFNFNNGYSNFWSNVLMLKEFKYIEATGAWSCLKSCPQPRFYLKDALNICNKHPEWREAFEADVKDCIKVNYIDKVSLDQSITELYDSPINEEIENLNEIQDNGDVE